MLNSSQLRSNREKKVRINKYQKIIKIGWKAQKDFRKFKKKMAEE